MRFFIGARRNHGWQQLTVLDSMTLNFSLLIGTNKQARDLRRKKNVFENVIIIGLPM
jgi:hypothetical protein